MTLPINHTAQPRELITTAVQWMSSGHRLVLATLVNIEGNAPYPIGSQMLIRDDAQFVGQITGGCAEQAIADQGVSAIESGGNQHHRYGLDSPFFDIQLPCGSGIDVYFDCCIQLDELTSIASELENRHAVVREIAGIDKTYLPTARIMIFGQGRIMLCLMQLAQLSGFDVMCIAQNEDTQRMLSIHGAKSTTLTQLPEGWTDRCDEYTAVVSLFHEHEHENAILAAAVKTSVFYVGALGSHRTHANRLIQLSEEGLSRRLLNKIRGPVGLDIAANTPSQIAVSILAEVIKVMNNDSADVN